MKGAMDSFEKEKADLWGLPDLKFMNLSTFATDRGFAAAVQRDLQVSSAREGSAIQRRQRLIH